MLLTRKAYVRSTLFIRFSILTEKNRFQEIKAYSTRAGKRFHLQHRITLSTYLVCEQNRQIPNRVIVVDIQTRPTDNSICLFV